MLLYHHLRLGYNIAASHSDSPSFKIKENPEITTDKHYISLNVEKYGGMIMSTWLDRPLSVAGYAVAIGRSGIKEYLVNADKDLLVMLVSALAGRENVLNAYEVAVKERYRFFSFGDAMFIK